MKKIVGGVLVIFSIVSCGEAMQIPENTNSSNQSETKATHVVFYNLENLFDTKNDPKTNDDWYTPGSDINWNKKRYEVKLEQLSKAISWTGKELPALIGLAEVENARCVQDLANTEILADGGYGISHFDSPDERGIDVALLYRKSMFSVEHEAPIEIKLKNDRTRDILHVEGLLGGEKMHVFVCHWSSRGEGVAETEHRRVAAATALRKEVDEILAKNNDAKILIMGDMNDHPTNKSISKVLNADCNDGPLQGDLMNLVCAEHKAGRGSYNYRGDWGYIDQFIVSGGLLNAEGWMAGEAKAFWDDRLLFRHPKYGKSPNRTYGGRKYHGGFSDHLPIILELAR